MSKQHGVANPSQALATAPAHGAMCPSGEFHSCSQQVLGPGEQEHTVGSRMASGSWALQSQQ